MSRHKMINGKLLQMNKSYSQLKNKQKMNISDWMFEAYKKQIETGISDEEAARYVSDNIDEAEIWVPNFDIEKNINP